MRNQALKALKRANQVRTERAELKRSLAAERTHIAEVIHDPPACAHTATILDALSWPRDMGEVKARRVLRAAGVRETRFLRDLTRHERLRIELALKERYAATWARWEEATA